MGNSGRYGKYGEKKRLERLRNSGAYFSTTGRRSLAPKEDPALLLKGIHESPIFVRRAGPGDVAYIQELSNRSFQQYGSYDNVLSQWFELGSTVTLLACQGKKAIGFAMLGNPLVNHHSPPIVMELLAIAVEPGRRRKGIGDLLMREVKNTAHQQRVEKLLLHTAVENLPARRLFKRHGFAAAQFKKSFYPHGQDALMMSVSLAQSVSSQ